MQGLHNWSVKEIVKEGKRSQKRMQLRTGKQTGSLFYLCDAIATLTCTLEKSTGNEKGVGGVG